MDGLLSANEASELLIQPHSGIRPAIGNRNLRGRDERDGRPEEFLASVPIHPAGGVVDLHDASGRVEDARADGSSREMGARNCGLLSPTGPGGPGGWAAWRKRTKTCKGLRDGWPPGTAVGESLFASRETGHVGWSLGESPGCCQSDFLSRNWIFRRVGSARDGLPPGAAGWDATHPWRDSLLAGLADPTPRPAAARGNLPRADQAPSARHCEGTALFRLPRGSPRAPEAGLSLAGPLVVTVDAENWPDWERCLQAGGRRR